MKKIIMLCGFLLGTQLCWSENFDLLIENNIPDGNTNIPGEIRGVIDTTDIFENRGLKITNVTLEIALTHTRAGDLAVELVSPSGTELQILARPGDAHPDEGRGNPTGSVANLIQAFPITFTDTASPTAEELGNGLNDDDEIGDVSPTVCSPNPDGWDTDITGFAGFFGEEPYGNWRIRIGDYHNGDTGTFHSAILTIQTEPDPPTCTAP